MASLLDSAISNLIPNLDGLDLGRHDSVVGTIVRVNAGFVAAIATIISARLYVRLKIVQRVGPDDILMVFAGFFTIALSAMCLVGTRFGLGRHEWDLNPATVIDSSTNIVKVLYATAVTITKASIIASYLRILPKPVFCRLMYTTTAVIIAFWVCSLFVTIFQCDPIQSAWDFTLQNKKCIGILKFIYVASSINILTDLVLCTSPLPLFWKLNIPLNERLILCMLFGLGLFVTAMSAIRLSQLHNLVSVDISYAVVSSLNWSVVEVGTGIVCACVPSMKPIIMHFFPGKFFSLPREMSRQTPRGPSVTLESERGGYGLDHRTRASRSVSTISCAMQGSDEGLLVSEGPKQKRRRGIFRSKSGDGEINNPEVLLVTEIVGCRTQALCDTGA